MVPNGVTVNAPNDGSGQRRKPEARGTRPTRIACIGRVNYWKGTDVLLDALQELAPGEVRATFGRYRGA